MWVTYLFLGILSLFLVALVISFYRKYQFEKNKKQRLQEPTINSSTFEEIKNSAAASTIEEGEISNIDVEIDREITIEANTVVAPTRDINSNAYIQDIIVLNIVAPSERQYAGYELLQALLAAGLRHGKMNIFHRHEQLNGRGEILFSVASMTEPGIFELNKMGGFSCTGLTLFMRLTSLKDPMQTFELLLDTAKQLLEDLGGILRDESHELLTEAKIKEWRMNIQNYEQTQHIADLFA